MPVFVKQKYVCDRCKAEVEDYRFPNGWMWLTLKQQRDEIELLICVGCRKKLTDFFEVYNRLDAIKKDFEEQQANRVQMSGVHKHAIKALEKAMRLVGVAHYNIPEKLTDMNSIAQNHLDKFTEQDFPEANEITSSEYHYWKGYKDAVGETSALIYNLTIAEK